MIVIPEDWNSISTPPGNNQTVLALLDSQEFGEIIAMLVYQNGAYWSLDNGKTFAVKWWLPVVFKREQPAALERLLNSNIDETKN